MDQGQRPCPTAWPLVCPEQKNSRHTPLLIFVSSSSPMIQVKQRNPPGIPASTPIFTRRKKSWRNVRIGRTKRKKRRIRMLKGCRIPRAAPTKRRPRPRILEQAPLRKNRANGISASALPAAGNRPAQSSSCWPSWASAAMPTRTTVTTWPVPRPWRHAARS